LLIPSRDAAANLGAEGIAADRVVFAGNAMIDSLHGELEAARSLDMPGRFGVAAGGYAMVTLHRPSNVDGRDSLDTILTALAELASELPVIFPIHPRTARQAAEFGLDGLLERVTVVPPLAYREMLGLVDSAACVLTDSGGLQEETTALGVPCITLREQTERPITLTEGTNRLAPWPLTVDGILGAWRAVAGEAPAQRSPPEGWDGRAAGRIVEALRSGLGTRSP
jgi:UDP-N-acetylglucosamine 2-epimerase (non-hydrolysing)